MVVCFLIKPISGNNRDALKNVASLKVVKSSRKKSSCYFTKVQTKSLIVNVWIALCLKALTLIENCWQITVFSS